MSDNPYRAQLIVQDEDGQDEVWDVAFRRLSAHDFSALVDIAGADLKDPTVVNRIVSTFADMTRSVAQNGTEWARDDYMRLPVDVVLEAYALHPSFRPEPEDED